MDYKCLYCKDEGWVVTNNGLTSSPCPMNCKEKEKVVIIGLGSTPDVVNGGKPPRNMFIDPLLNKDVSSFGKMIDVYESAKPKFNSEVSKFLVFGTGGEIDRPNIKLFSAGSFDEVYLPAVIYHFDCFINRGFYSDCIKGSRFYRELTKNIMYGRVDREIKG